MTRHNLEATNDDNRATNALQPRHIANANKKSDEMNTMPHSS